ncbi:hypothetical protein LXL04_025688 [Taraxacum kok-saghyz]
MHGSLCVAWVPEKRKNTASSSLTPTPEKHSTRLLFLPCVFFQSFLFFRCAIPPSSLRPTAAVPLLPCVVQSSSSRRCEEISISEGEDEFNRDRT